MALQRIGRHLLIAVAILLILPPASAAPGAGNFVLSGKAELPKNAAWEFNPLLLFNNDSQGIGQLSVVSPSITLKHFRFSYHEASTSPRDVQVAYEHYNRTFPLTDVALQASSGDMRGYIAIYPTSETRARMVSASGAALEPRKHTEIETANVVGEEEGAEETQFWYKQTLDEAHMMSAFPGFLHLEGPFAIKFYGPELHIVADGQEGTRFQTGVHRSSELPVRTMVREWVILEVPEGGYLDADAASTWAIAAQDLSADWVGEAVFNPVAGALETWQTRYSPIGGAVRLSGDLQAVFVPREDRGLLLADMTVMGDVQGTTLHGEAVPLGTQLVKNRTYTSWGVFLAGVVVLAAGGVSIHRLRKRPLRAAAPPMVGGALACPSSEIRPPLTESVVEIPLTAEDCVAFGDKAMAEQNWPEGAHWFERALRLAPTSSRVCANLAHALYEIGDAQGALTYYQKASDLAPERDELPDFLAAVVALNAGQPLEEVEQWLLRALERNPEVASEISANPDFGVLRGRPRFDQALAEAWDEIEGQDPT